MAGIRAPISVALNATTYTAITAPGISSISVFTDDLSAFYIAKDSSGTSSVLIPANTSPSWEKVFPEPDGTVLWAKAVSGTPNLILLSSAKG